MMKLEVKGHSGCQIDVVREDGKLFIYKSTFDKGYLDRLSLQGQKQQEAAQIGLQHIRVPQICEIHRDDESVSIKMEYVYSKSFVGYFEYAGFEQISYFIKALCLFLDYEVKNSSMQVVSAEVLRQKFADVEIEYYQSNVEGEIINKLHEVGFSVDGVVLNAGGYTHTSVAIADAVSAIKTPVVEVHITNIYAREEERRVSLLSKASVGVISGFGLDSYRLAMEFLCGLK
jgi:3-dehydroquinate dehydratase-2